MLFGPIPSSFEALQNLKVLELASNNLSGEIPSTLGSCISLQILDLSNQRISGNIPQSLTGLLNLEVLSLGNNDIEGPIPSNFIELKNLKVINCSGNMLSGSLPLNLGNLQNLRTLSLSSNLISGGIPFEIGNCSNLIILELKHNLLEGFIPPQLSTLFKLRILDLGHNRFFGSIPETIMHCRQLTNVDLGNNQLSGQIPPTLDKLSELVQLNLMGNHLTGSIPSSLGHLIHLKILDLSKNSLTGAIPASLGNLEDLRDFNVSGNKLNGLVPPALGAHFNSTAFGDNPSLCGGPLNLMCPNSNKEGHIERNIIIGVSVAAGVLAALLASVIIFSLVKFVRKDKKPIIGGREMLPTEEQLIMFQYPVYYACILEATGHYDEEHVLSRTRYDITFKACLQDGTMLSVRRFSDGVVDEIAFRAGAEILAGVKHKNLHVLRGYYIHEDVKLLIYDYMPNGNLAALLQEAAHQDGHVLNWPMRHLIALGISRGLAFLHTQCEPYIVHGDVKPGNIQFDADFEAHLSDFCMERLFLIPLEPPSSSLQVGSFGYVASEAYLTGQPTTEGDVYSFGIVLLELLTGRGPVMFTQDEDIVKWVKRQLQSEQVSELFDPSFLELDPESSEWEEFLLAVKVALLCTSPDPMDRPSMTEVVLMLEGCRGGMDVPNFSSDPRANASGEEVFS
ncbi:hypothetical protein O6H91_16G018700 [Diphasiastrum complanatum]|nr:hypothetical protein O6H91_16G018700 [Diphasiastrum complanatum]